MNKISFLLLLYGRKVCTPPSPSSNALAPLTTVCWCIQAPRCCFPVVRWDYVRGGGGGGVMAVHSTSGIEEILKEIAKFRPSVYRP